MKEIVLKLIAELLKDARKSDRDLAKAIGVSQPTASRIRTRLEQEGFVREYAMIPDFRKLGYEIIAVTFMKLQSKLEQGDIEKIRELAKERPRISLMILS